MPKFDKSTGYKMSGPSWYGGDSGSPVKHKPKESGAWEAKYGDKPEKDTHKHPHTEEVQAVADYHTKGDARYKDAQGKTGRAFRKGPRKDVPVILDMYTKSEVRDLSDAEANPKYYKPTEKSKIKNPKYKK